MAAESLPDWGSVRAKCADLLGAGEGRHPPLLLLGSAESQDEVGAQPKVGDVDHAGGPAAPRYLLGGDGELARSAPAAAVLLVDGQAEQAQLCKLAYVVPRELAPLVVVGGAGREDLVRKLADHGLEEPFFLG